jgi:hypothetical protein
MGRPAHEPTPMSRRNVEALAGYGVPEVDIAGVIGIDPKTLRKHYPQELRYGHVKANAKVAENLFRKATGDGRESVIAAIFWMKTRAQWKETQVTEMTGPPPSITVRWMGPTQKPKPEVPSDALSGAPPGERGLKVIDGDLALPPPVQSISSRKGA